MRSFFVDAMTLEEGSKTPSINRKVVVIGSDCARVGQRRIAAAFDRLNHQPVVIGPSSDGGYYLIGMRQQCYEIFDNIAWSTSQVLEQTVTAMNDARIGFELLPEMTDVDEWEDLQDLMTELRHASATGSRSAKRLLTRLQPLF